jgi:hypothetical protein
MRAPVLAVGDGALGFWNALNEVFPDTRHQRCWVHKTANVLDALPKSAQPAAKRAVQEIYNAEDKQHAARAVRDFERAYGAKYPRVVRRVTDDEDELLAFFDFPAEHWIHLRTTNPIESTFATVRLRTKVTKGAGSRAAALAMVFKADRVRPGPLAGRERAPPRRPRPRRSPLRTRPPRRASRGRGRVTKGKASAMTAHSRQVLLDLVRWNGQIDDLIVAARVIPEGELPAAVLDRADAQAALRKVLTGEVLPGDLSAWTQELHMREDIDIESGHEDLLTQFLFEMSTPELFEPITRELCSRWLDALRATA